MSIQRDTLQRLIALTGLHVPGVAAIEARPGRLGEGGLSVQCRATMGPGAYPGPLAAELRARLRDTLNRMLGLRLDTLRLELVAPNTRPLVYELRG